MTSEVTRVFEGLLRAVQQGQEGLLAMAQTEEDKLTQMELQNSEHKAQMEQLSAEVAQQQRDSEDKDGKLQEAGEEKRALEETVRQLKEELEGLRQELQQLKGQQEQLAESTAAAVPSHQVPMKGTGFVPELPLGEADGSSSRSSSASSVTDPPKAEEPASEEEEDDEEDTQEPKGAEEVVPESVPAAPASRALSERPRSRSRPLLRGGGRLRSLSPGAGDPQPKSSARRVTKRADSRRPLARSRRSPERHERQARETRPLPPPPPRAERGRTRQVARERDKVCFSYCFRGTCKAGDACPLRHPPKEDAEKIMQNIANTPCREGKDCKRAVCHFKHPPSHQGGAGGKRVRTKVETRDRRR